MFGTEAIWWLNSVLLALLTHAGLLWMVATGEPDEPQKPSKTTIVIENLPTPQDTANLPVNAKAQPVDERSQIQKVEETITASKLASDEAEQASRILEAETAITTDEVLEKAETQIASDEIEVVEDDPSVQRSDVKSEKAEQTNAAETVSTPISQPTTNPVEDEAASVGQAEGVENTAVAVATQTSTEPTKADLERAGKAGSTDKALSVQEDTVVEATAAPETPVEAAATAPVTQPIEDNEVASSQNSLTQPEQPEVKQAEKLAVLSRREEVTEVPEARSEVSTIKTQPVSTEDSNETVKPQKKFVFPKNVQRLKSTATKTAKKVEPERVGRVRSDAANDNAAEPVTKSTSDQAEQVAVLSPQKAGRVKPDSRFRDLLRFLEGNEITGCATVLPTVAADGSVSLSGFAANEDLWTTFQQSMDEKLRLRLPLDAATVAAPQCRALTFARTLPDYPRFSLGMKLENTELVSGETLRGTITDVRNRHLHLLIVDDEGLVQQIDNFLQPKVSNVTFAVALSVSGQAVRTAQMLIAIATEAPLETVATANATQAESFFSILSEELADPTKSADIAIVSFYLRSN